MDQIFKEFGNTIAGVFSSEIVQLAIRGIGIYFVVAWLATAFWAYQDMKSRSANPILPFLAAAFIVAATPLFFIFAAILYRIVRPHERVGEAHERMLAEEAMLAEVEQLDHCTGCGRRIAEGWMVCPTCRTRLRRVCPSCGKLVGADWAVCAWCGVDFDRQPGRAAVVQGSAARPSRGQVRPASPAPAPIPVPYAAAASATAAPADAPGRPAAQPASATLQAVPAPAPTPAASPRAAPSPSPSPFRSISTDLDAEEIGALVVDPVAPAGSTTASSGVATEEVPTPAPARVSGRRVAGR